MRSRGPGDARVSSAKSQLIFKLTAVIAIALGGCPTATGRARGPLDNDGGPCAVARLPATNETCASDGVSCDYLVPCDRSMPATSRAIQRCACSAGRWRCSLLACEAYLPDGGGLACPQRGTPQAQTFACDPRLEGRTCPLSLVRCANGSTPITNCTCDGTYWQCPASMCPEPPPPPPPNLAGQACANDSACEPLRCDTTRTRTGICTAPCTPGASPSTIAAQCRHAEAQCVASESTPTTGFCTRACANSSMCAADTVCGALHVGEPTIACVPFCLSDASCPVGTRCRRASGQCSNRGDAPTLLPNGAPCTDNPGQPFQCEGRCVRVTTSVGARSMCVGVRVGAACPTIHGMAQVERRVGSITYCLGAASCTPTGPCCPGESVCEFRREFDTLACGDDTPMPNAPCARDASVDAMVDASSDARDADTTGSDAAMDAGD